jgi:hypothetical protein
MCPRNRVLYNAAVDAGIGSKRAYGDEGKFDLNYGALLSSMTTPYVSKSYTNGVTDQQN